MSTRPNLSTAALTILSQFSSELGLNAELFAIRRDLFQFVDFARREDNISPGACERFRRQRTESTRRTGDNCGLAFDIE